MGSLWENKKVLAFVFALQEAFAATVPFFVLIALIKVTHILLARFNVANPDIAIHLMNSLQSASSITVVVTIAYYLGRRTSVNPVVSAILASASFIVVLFVLRGGAPITAPKGFAVVNLAVPIISTYLLKVLYPKFSLKLPMNIESKHVYRLIDHWPVFFVALAATVALYSALFYLTNPLIHYFSVAVKHLPNAVEMFVRDSLANMLWFIGLHGQHITNALLGFDLPAAHLRPNLSWGEFNRLFINIGGSGLGLALWIALAVNLRGGTLRTLTRAAAPFVIFDINEILIYAVVVLNRIFFVPFVLLPMVNFILAYIFVITVPVHYASVNIIWSNPPILNAYLIGSGDSRLIIFQIGMILMDTAVYSHYVRRFIRAQSMDQYQEILRQNLNIKGHFCAQENLRAYAAQKEVMDASIQLERLIPHLREQNLYVHYQPIVDLKDPSQPRVEALIRYLEDGELKGPNFLDLLEQAGLAPVVDVWVSQTVRRDLESWKKAGLETAVSINIHPDTLANREAARAIVDNLQGERVSVEIIERSFLYGDSVERILALFRQNGFRVTIDDFGSGYSNLETIVSHDLSELKIAMSLVRAATETKGFAAVQKMAQLSHELGMTIVAEGVENEDQLRSVIAAQVDFVQGFYFSPALTFEEVIDYYSNQPQLSSI